MISQKCRFCNTKLKQTFVDLGMSPLANAYVKPEALQSAEKFYPLHVYVCSNCYLVQLDEVETPERIFGEYAYFSSFSDTWLKHCEDYTAQVVKKFQLNENSKVIELASNDGYLLQYFKLRDISVLGVEPAGNVAQVAIKKGIPTLVKFFGEKTAKELAQEGHQADLLIANNVLAHVPDLNDFVKGMKIVLKSTGLITIEFPYLLNLMAGNQFDTIYHEHFSYFSFLAVENVFKYHGFQIFDVEELKTHGGSLRIYVCHQEDKTKEISIRVAQLRNLERENKLDNLETYRLFAEGVKETKRKILEFLIQVKRTGKAIVAYGAPAKGNTLLNYCGIRSDFLDFTVDRSPYKQGMYLPGVHIPIKEPNAIQEAQPNYVLILPWNLKDEIIEQIAYIREWGGQFVVPIPEIEVYS